MRNNFLKIVTTRNPFSREYGTWIIVLLNLIFTPIYLREFSIEALYITLSILFFILFRFELLDIFSLKFPKKKKLKKIVIILFLILLSAISFIMFYLKVSSVYFLLLIPVSIVLLILNIITRRRKGQRQNILAQLVLTGSFGFIPSLLYYVLTKNVDVIFWQVGICNALYYINSTLYVRSKTVGSPYDSYAFAFTVLIFVIGWILISREVIETKILILFLPTLIKGLDNLVLANFKVPLRRIGLNETFQSILFIILYNVCF